MEALGTTPAPQVGGTRAYSPRSSALLAQLGLDGPQYLPQQLAGNKHSPRLNALQGEQKNTCSQAYAVKV